MLIYPFRLVCSFKGPCEINGNSQCTTLTRVWLQFITQELANMTKEGMHAVFRHGRVVGEIGGCTDGSRIHGKQQIWSTFPQ